MKIIQIALIVIITLVSCNQKVRVDVIQDKSIEGTGSLKEEHIETDKKTTRILKVIHKGDSKLVVEWSITREIGETTINEILSLVQDKIKNGILKGKENIAEVKVRWKAKDINSYTIKMTGK